MSEKVPDATTLVKLTKKYGDIVEELNRLLLEKAKEEKVIRSRKVRVDTTVVEANIHYPTDAGLIADGIRKVSKEMQKAQELGVGKGEKVVDRTRSVKKRLARIGNILRGRAKQKMQEIDEVTKELIGLGKAGDVQIRELRNSRRNRRISSVPVLASTPSERYLAYFALLSSTPGV